MDKLCPRRRKHERTGKTSNKKYGVILNTSFTIIYVIRMVEGVSVLSLTDLLSIFLIPEEMLHINLDFFCFSPPLQFFSTNILYD